MWVLVLFCVVCFSLFVVVVVRVVFDVVVRVVLLLFVVVVVVRVGGVVVGPLRRTAQNFARFSVSCHHFVLSLTVCLLVEFWWFL